MRVPAVRVSQQHPREADARNNPVTLISALFPNWSNFIETKMCCNVGKYLYKGVLQKWLKMIY